MNKEINDKAQIIKEMREIDYSIIKLHKILHELEDKTQIIRLINEVKIPDSFLPPDETCELARDLRQNRCGIHNAIDRIEKIINELEI